MRRAVRMCLPREPPAPMRRMLRRGVDMVMLGVGWVGKMGGFSERSCAGGRWVDGWGWGYVG